jgi:hypothetical protein
MNLSSSRGIFLLGIVVLGRLVACSASTGPGSGSQPIANVGGSPAYPVAPSTPAGASGVGAFMSAPTRTGPSFFNIKDAGPGVVRSHDSSCGAVAEVPEQITVYKEASVTDTTYTYTPVALFIMQDRSGSMVTGFPPPASPMSWDNSTAAITAFVNDPMSKGVDVGLGTFPAGAANTADCSMGSDCGTPVVPIAPLPGNAQNMISAMNAQKPNSPLALTPTECGLRGMINQCLTFHSNSPAGEKCVAVLVTDGVPDQCDTTQSDLVQIITDGHSKGIDTYTLGLPGADLNVLNQYAMAGGTGMAIDVSGGAQAFIAALNSIRAKVAHTDKHTVVTSHVIQTPLKCEWKIPPQQMGAPPLDPEKVNLQYTPPNAQPVQFGHVPGASMCPPTANAWYFDDEKTPTQIFLCPNTCAAVDNVMGARIDILLHCPRIEAPPA